MRFLSIIEFTGHFHPLLVHLPIGILLVALLLQWLSGREKYRALKAALPVILLSGVITGALSCITGLLLSFSDDYDKKLINWHLWMALGLLVVAFLLYLKESNEQFHLNKKLLSGLLFVLIMLTGHLGGSLTHGSGYITKPLADIFSNDSTATMAIKPLANVQEALVYNDVVRPILQTKCFGCHNADKQKGGLRMDEIPLLLKGGKKGKVLLPGNAEESEMIKRLLLPVDNDKHMPPKEKPQPSESQIALLQWWIESGAGFTNKVAALEQPAKIKPLLTALQQPVVIVKKDPADVPVTAVVKADEKILSELKSHSIIILPVAQNSNYLEASFVTDPIVDGADLKMLQQVKRQLIWLKLNNTSINDSLAPALAQLTSLTRLNISNTLLTDKGLVQLATLRDLQYLNVSGTKVTAAGLARLQALTKLKNLYLYRTNVKSNDYKVLKQVFPSVDIDSGGYQVPLLISDTTKVKAGKK